MTGLVIARSSLSAVFLVLRPVGTHVDGGKAPFKRLPVCLRMYPLRGKEGGEASVPQGGARYRSLTLG